MKQCPAIILSLLFFAATALAQSSNPPTADTPRMKTCFQCEGSGKMKCPTCQGTGEADCPGPCLKLSRGKWQHMKVADHPDSDLWMKFNNPDNTWTAYNQNHAGDVIKLENGHWVDAGKCPVCGGKGKVKCRACDAKGQVTCTLCNGQGQIPDSWTAFDNPRLAHRPDRFVLKDGSVVVGFKVAMTGDRITVRTADGKVEIASADLLRQEHQSTSNGVSPGH